MALIALTKTNKILIYLATNAVIPPPEADIRVVAALLKKKILLVNYL